jgi:hypothetical protein
MIRVELKKAGDSEPLTHQTAVAASTTTKACQPLLICPVSVRRVAVRGEEVLPGLLTPLRAHSCGRLDEQYLM